MLNQKNFKDLVGEFKTFHQKNPEVYKLFVQFTLQAINKGHAKLSSEMIINRIRWETSVITTDKDYKINNIDKTSATILTILTIQYDNKHHAGF